MSGEDLMDQLSKLKHDMVAFGNNLATQESIQPIDMMTIEHMHNKLSALEQKIRKDRIREIFMQHDLPVPSEFRPAPQGEGGAGGDQSAAKRLKTSD